MSIPAPKSARSSNAMASSQLFQYSELVDTHDIRVLQLEKSTIHPRQGTINGRLKNVSLDDFVNGNDPPQYIAMSYCWGDPKPTDRIWLTNDTSLPINAACAHLLRNITGSSNIWIDSVCINQQDNDEKSRQVMMMWGIYRFADHVYAWLGGPEDDAIKAMHLAFDAANPCITKVLTGRDPVWLPTDLSHRCAPFDFEASAWGALVDLLERPWFRRMWVIREVVAARDTTLVCTTGSINEYLSWKDLVKVIEHLRTWDHLNRLNIKDARPPWAPPKLPRRIEGITRIQTLLHVREGQRQSIQQNLMLTATAEASNPRDIIFALGSMSEGTLVEALIPRYDLPASKVFINATQYMISHDKQILVLHMAGIGWNRSSIDLPSWVPDYSHAPYDQIHERKHFVLGQLAALRPALYSASSKYTFDEPAKVETWPWAPRIISLHGIVIDRIRKPYPGLPLTRGVWNSLTAGTYQRRKEVLVWYNKTKNGVCQARNLQSPYLNGKDQDAPCLLDAFRRTLVVGFGCEQIRGLAGNLTREYFDAFTAFLRHTVSRQGGDPKVELFDEDRLKKASSYIQALDQISDWSTFRTSKDYIGRGPPLVQENDYVCVFQGGRTPFNIRQTVSGVFGPCRAYKLVGECYVQGLMRKQAYSSSRRCWGPILLH